MTPFRFLISLLVCCSAAIASQSSESTPASRYRILVCTDVGGTDFDDYQSLVHLFVYADEFDLEGMVSSPMGGPGRLSQILRVIEVYEKDYPALRHYSKLYPAPEQLRSISKQGATKAAGLQGFEKSTDGSNWIIHCAKREDPRPLWLLMWGGMDDLAQALHDDPSIKSKLRVYYIGGPNKKWNPTAYDYIAREHPDLWIIEANSTYYGWFVGGNQTGEWGNTAYVAQDIAGSGELGNFFARLEWQGKIRDTIKMGDTPSLAYLLNGTPEDPAKTQSWGGSFVRAWERPRNVFDNAQKTPPTTHDIVETYAIVDIIYRAATPIPLDTTCTLIVDGQEFPAFVDESGAAHFVYCPKTAKSWIYTTKSTLPVLNGLTGGFTSVDPTPAQANHPSAKYPHWWTDNPAPELGEEGQQGAKTVNRWREDFLRDFAGHMLRCRPE